MNPKVIIGLLFAGALAAVWAVEVRDAQRRFNPAIENVCRSSVGKQTLARKVSFGVPVHQFIGRGHYVMHWEPLMVANGSGFMELRQHSCTANFKNGLVGQTDFADGNALR